MKRFSMKIHLLLVFVAAITSSQLATAQSKSAATSTPLNACEIVIRQYVDNAYAATAMDLQVRISAYEAAKLGLDKEPTPGEGWHEGNPYWEEVYGIYYPKILQHMQEVMARESSYKKSTLPTLLDPDLCGKHWTLINTKHGKVAGDISYSIDLQRWLKRLEQNTLATKRLQIWVDKTRREIEKGLSIFDRPEFRANQALYRKAYQDILEFDKHILKAAELAGDAYTEKDKALSREFSAEMFSLNKDKLTAIVLRFKASTK